MKKILLLFVAAVLTACQLLEYEEKKPTITVPTITNTSVIISTYTATPTITSTPTSTATITPEMGLGAITIDMLNHLEGDLSGQIVILEKNMPRANSDRYVVPSVEQMAGFSELMTLMLENNLPEALAVAEKASFSFELFSDLPDKSQQSILLREINPVRFGWGLYVFNPKPKNQFILEAPHPLADANTSLISLQLFRVLNARALLIAGAHRGANIDGSADVAHAQDSIFQVVHQSLLNPESVVLQVHGFSSDKHPGYPQVILGQNSNTDMDLIRDVAEKLEEKHVSTGICDGTNWLDLCGETNTQSNTMIYGKFIHIELNENMRNEPGKLINAIKEVFLSQDLRNN